MTYKELEGAKALPSSIQKKTDIPPLDPADHSDRLENLKSLWRQLGDPDIGSYGLRRLISHIETHSRVLTGEVQDIMRLRIRGILEEHIEKWLLSGDDQVYNVLDIVIGYGTARSSVLENYDMEWFRENKGRFLVAAAHGYRLAIKQNNIGVAEKITILFPEFTASKPH